MPFEARISEISAKLAKRKDDSEALKLTQKLQEVLHERIEYLRTKASGMVLLPEPTKKIGWKMSYKRKCARARSPRRKLRTK
jgi:hypothetical protein